MAGLAVTCSKLCSFSTFGARSALISTRIKQGLTIRLLSSTQQNSRKVDKSLLSRLRKETGFGFAKCMEGLQASNNDYDTALTWLKAEAEKQGWEKAAKLQGRAAAEGLVGVLVDGNFGAMVEVNCETDFVARNELFVDLVSNVANTAMAKRKKIVDQNQKINTFAGEFEHLREVIPEHKLRNEEVQNSGETVAETVARTIGKLGENIKISKVVTMTTEVSNVMGSYTHGPFVKSVAGCSLGRYGGLVALRPKDSTTSLNSVKQLANKIAQHVVGMNPKVIAQDGSGKNDSALDGETSDVLLEQEYLLDDSLTVKDFLEKEGVEVVDFVRYECGTQ